MSPISNDRRHGNVSSVMRAPDPGVPGTDHRSVAMLQADALALFCSHVLGCKAEKLPLAGATAIVRMNVDDLESETGTATIDGIDQPISAAAARRIRDECRRDMARVVSCAGRCARRSG